MARIIYRNQAGSQIPGVTTVIANLGWNTRALMHWAWKQGMEGLDYKAEKDIAANIGTAAMKMIEIEVTMGQLVDEDIERLVQLYTKEVVEKALTAYESWQRWCASHEFTVLAAEESLVSEEFQCGGTLDLRLAFTIAKVHGRLSVVDVKVTKDIYPEHIIQVATYAAMRNELFPEEPIQELHWLKLGKESVSFDHEFLTMDSPKAQAAIEVFRHLRAIHDLRKKLR